MVRVIVAMNRKSSTTKGGDDGGDGEKQERNNKDINKGESKHRKKTIIENVPYNELKQGNKNNDSPMPSVGSNNIKNGIINVDDDDDDDDDEISRIENNENRVNVSRPTNEIDEGAPTRLSEDDSGGPWFCYLMIQLGGACKNEAKIIVAREIFFDSYLHNSGGVNDKGTKAARGLWAPEMVIGPFTKKKRAEDFKGMWMKDSRGILPRRDRGIELVKSALFGDDLRCYDKRIVPFNLCEWMTKNKLDTLCLPEKTIEDLFRSLGIKGNEVTDNTNQRAIIQAL